MRSALGVNGLRWIWMSKYALTLLGHGCIDFERIELVWFKWLIAKSNNNRILFAGSRRLWMSLFPQTHL
jgi:hypothetical protein